MTIQKTLDDKKLTVSIEGRLDTLTAPELEEMLEPAMNGLEALVIDLTDLAYISSAGLRVLVNAAQVMEAQNGEMKVLNANADVRNIFDITGLTDALGVE